VISQSQASIAQLEAELTALKVANTSSPEAVAANLEQQDRVSKQLADERSNLSDALRTMTSIYQIILDTNTNQMEIIQPATTATLVDQQLWLRVISSGVGGLILAIILIFLAEHFDDRIRFPGDLSRAAGVPLLSTIDKHANRKGSALERLVTFADPESEPANRYREVVAKLLLSIGESNPYSLLLSSVGSKAGTAAAVTAGNLAVAFAQAGYKVALVDAQVDQPLLTTLFKAEKREGLADVVMTKSAELQLLPVEQISGMQFLPPGLSSEKSSHAMLNPANVTALFERLQKEADIVLVAASPISRFAESLTLASQADSVILVAPYAEARSKVVSTVVENLRPMKVNLAGVIFDYNPSPALSTKDRGMGSRLGRETSADGIKKGNLSERTTES
jgi:Mrp family chromosome partitioning ATPase